MSLVERGVNKHADRVAQAVDAGEQIGMAEVVGLAQEVVRLERRPVDMMRESRIARARGMAQAIAECRDDARLDGIREGAAEIVQLLAERPV